MQQRVKKISFSQLFQQFSIKISWHQLTRLGEGHHIVDELRSVSRGDNAVVAR